MSTDCSSSRSYGGVFNGRVMSSLCCMCTSCSSVFIHRVVCTGGGVHTGSSTGGHGVNSVAMSTSRRVTSRRMSWLYCRMRTNCCCCCCFGSSDCCSCAGNTGGSGMGRSVITPILFSVACCFGCCVPLTVDRRGVCCLRGVVAGGGRNTQIKSRVF
ncbi:hypothetical protein BDF14DRAFT_1786696 [Spinellus fusiger]|nr:hypothetical protein BDF14DRAFT_1786696 [Spinellus fusiger]